MLGWAGVAAFTPGGFINKKYQACKSYNSNLVSMQGGCNIGDVRSAGSVTMRRTERSGAETWLDEAARRGGGAVRRHGMLRRQPPSFDGGPFIGTKHTLHRLLVGRDSRLSRPVSGRDRPCHGRNPTTVHNHRLTSPCRKTERKRTETREVHNKTRNSFPKLQNGKRDGRHLSPTKK